MNVVHELTTNGIGFWGLTRQGANIDTTTSSDKLVFAIFAALAEFERELIRERTVAGLAAARVRGRKGGQPPGMTPAKLRLAQAAMQKRDTTITTLCKELGITKHTRIPLRRSGWQTQRAGETALRKEELNGPYIVLPTAEAQALLEKVRER